MNILVTGSKGIIGTALVKELNARGHGVFGLDVKHECDSIEYEHSRTGNYIRCDVADYRQLERAIKKFNIHVVYHLAAEFGRINGEEYYEQLWRTNVIGTRNILELQKIMDFKLIFASSSEVYGEMKEAILTEDLIIHRQKNDYAISKYVNEQQCLNFRERHGNKIMILRFFNTYGPGEYYSPYRSVVCLFCYHALFNKTYDVYEGYDRAFMYVGDFIPALANACINFIDGEMINIGGKDAHSVKHLSDLVLKALGKDDSLVRYIDQDKHNVVSKFPDIKKAREILSFNPTTSLEEGVKNTIEWMKEVYCE